MGSFITIFTTLMPLLSTIVGAYLSGKKSRAELDKAINDFWAKRGEGNQSADDREEAEKQRERLELLIKEEQEKNTDGISEN